MRQGGGSCFYVSYNQSAFADFVLHSLTQPLFHHALVIQEASSCEPFDARQHSRIHSKRDGHRFGAFGGAGDRRLHQPQIGPMVGPKNRLGLLAVEDGNIFPMVDGIDGWHGSKLNFTDEFIVIATDFGRACADKRIALQARRSGRV